MRHPRTTAGIALALALTGLFGCSSSSPKASTGTTIAGSPTTSTSDGGDSGGSAAASDVCTKITAAEVAAIVGGEVKVEAVPGGGCRFSQDDPRAAAAAFDSTSFEGGASDYDTAKSGVTGLIEGTPEDAPGVGDKAFLVVGTTMGGSNLQGGGLVSAGKGLAQVTLTQGKDLGADDVKNMTTKLMTLAASKL